ncbi:MAG: copper chaperone PCu(A)C [Pseudomonadota bacterium]
MKPPRFSALAGALFTAAVCAADALMVHEGWVREMPPGTQVAAAYFSVHNPGDRDRHLVGADTAAAQRVELHTVEHADGTMRMRQVNGIAVPAGGTAILEPGGLHVMLLGVDTRLVAGDSVTLNLRFANGTSRAVVLPVQRGTAKGHGGHSMNHDNH